MYDPSHFGPMYVGMSGIGWGYVVIFPDKPDMQENGTKKGKSDRSLKCPNLYGFLLNVRYCPVAA